MQRLLRHIEACRNAVLPGARLPFRIGADQVGWVKPKLAEALAGFAEMRADHAAVVLDPARAARLPAIARVLTERGCFRFRGEAFDVRAAPDGPVLTTLDRGSLPAFGVLAEGVHLNGLVQRPDGPWLWVGRRAAHKLLDPGKLDHIVAGGVPAGMTAAATLVKEAAEEAAIAPASAARAALVARIGYVMERPEGLRRDLLSCYDLWLPEAFVPRPADGEVAAFELWPLPRVLEAVAETDDFKFNVNLVLIDLFLRTGLIDPDGPDGRALRPALNGWGSGASGPSESRAEPWPYP
jgi:8-oxo-dGTP pyrophosphatase MutT (NUDIX family)